MKGALIRILCGVRIKSPNCTRSFGTSSGHLLYGVEHLALQNSISRYIAEKINPNVDEWERVGSFPAGPLFRDFGKLGVFGVNKPTEYGGAGLDFSYSVAVAEALGSVHCGSIPMASSVQSDMATPALAAHGSHHLKSTYLAPSISGERIACLGVSEESAGSDVAAIRTHARRDRDDLIVNGSKMWITNAHQADWVCLLLNTPVSTFPHRNKSLVCVDLNEPGVRIGLRIEKLGMRSSDTAQIFFEGVRVPYSNIIGDEGSGFIYQMEQFQNERLVTAAVAVAPLQRAISITTQYAMDRRMFQSTEFGQQYVAYRLAEMATELEALRSLLYRATWEKVNGAKDVTLLASMAKLKAGRLARQITDGCLQLWGGNGFCWDNAISRMYRDLRVLSIGAGCDEGLRISKTIQPSLMLSIIAQALGRGLPIC